MTQTERLSKALSEVHAAKKPSCITTLTGQIEIRHDAGIVIVWAGKKARAQGASCILRLTLPSKQPLPAFERIVKMGGMNFSILDDDVRWACNWMGEFVSRDGKAPLTKQERAQLDMARYIMVGIKNEETIVQKQKLRKKAEEVDYKAEFKHARREVKNQAAKAKAKAEAKEKREQKKIALQKLAKVQTQKTKKHRK